MVQVLRSREESQSQPSSLFELLSVLQGHEMDNLTRPHLLYMQQALSFSIVLKLNDVDSVYCSQILNCFGTKRLTCRPTALIYSVPFLDRRLVCGWYRARLIETGFTCGLGYSHGRSSTVQYPLKMMVRKNSSINQKLKKTMIKKFICGVNWILLQTQFVF